MTKSEKLIEIVRRINESKYGVVLDILNNDDVSSDAEIVDLLVDETKFSKDKLSKLVKSIRSKFLKNLYKDDKEAIKDIQKFL